MRGDRPLVAGGVAQALLFTPHARGSTQKILRKKVYFSVYPACAGIDRSRLQRDTQRQSLPRMRGDRPYITVTVEPE